MISFESISQMLEDTRQSDLPLWDNIRRSDCFQQDTDDGKGPFQTVIGGVLLLFCLGFGFSFRGSHCHRGRFPGLWRLHFSHRGRPEWAVSRSICSMDVKSIMVTPPVPVCSG